MERAPIPVSTILKRKGDWVITIAPSATVFETIERMVEHNVGAIVVTKNGELCGIFTERDYLRRIALEGRTSRTTRVEEVMTADVICVDPDATVQECLQLMTENRCRHLPVLREGKHLGGIISIGDCVRALSEHAERQVENLTSYIAGSYPG
jgi:CBS domain-containing protein